MQKEIPIVYRRLSGKELSLLLTIDRGEEITFSYRLQNDKLMLIDTPETVAGFEQGEGEMLVKRQQNLLAAGGIVTGAFASNRLVGIASVENKKRGIQSAFCKMDILYVDRSFRGLQIGQQLLIACKQAAEEIGAAKLYISATPTKNTVDFYLRNGATLAAERDEELYVLEPEDIHLELSVCYCPGTFDENNNCCFNSPGV